MRQTRLVLFRLEQDVGPYHLHDAWKTISLTVMEKNSDFEFYRTQARAWSRDRNITGLEGAKGPKSPSDLAAWTLDKYKNMHILEKNWKLKPNMEW